MTDEELYAQLSAFITDNKRALFDRIAPMRTRHVTVVLEDIYQSHNASAVVRTCDLLGFDLDSPVHGRFDTIDAQGMGALLEALVEALEGGSDWQAGTAFG